MVSSFLSGTGRKAKNKEEKKKACPFKTSSTDDIACQFYSFLKEEHATCDSGFTT